MHSNKEKLLEKLQKLFALSKSDNQHESELALAKANQMMEEHKIGMTEIDLFDDGGSITQEDSTIEGVKPYTKNIMTLAAAAAMFYNGKSVRLVGGRHAGIRMRFYGTPTDIAAATTTFNYLLTSWKSIADFDLKNSDYTGNAKIFKNSHMYGFSNTIYKRVQDLLAERNTNVFAATGRDLVVVKNAALDDYMKGSKIRRVSSSLRNFSQSGGYQAGQVSGQNIPLSGAINHESTRMIGR